MKNEKIVRHGRSCGSIEMRNKENGVPSLSNWGSAEMKNKENGVLRTVIGQCENE